MPDNRRLRDASKSKADEFYTMLSDIEKELRYYENQFKDKIVFCNCDDPTFSNFFKYFQMNFYRLGLKKLICTHYEYDNPSYKLEIVRQENKVGQISFIPQEVMTPLQENGDFRSEECIELLKEADIVVTNPPFSLFREYIEQLMTYEKKFLIIGNQNAITYKEFFPLLKENKVWMGASIHGGDREFRVPASYNVSKNYRYDEEGNKYVRVRGPRWWTNMDYRQRHDELVLYKRYNEIDYPKYDNYNAINVNVTADIPMDYDGYMGVPITFMDKYCPEQFELFGIMNTGEENKGIRYKNTPHGRPLVDGKELYLRILIKRKK